VNKIQGKTGIIITILITLIWMLIAVSLIHYSIEHLHDLPSLILGIIVLLLAVYLYLEVMQWLFKPQLTIHLSIRGHYFSMFPDPEDLTEEERQYLIEGLQKIINQLKGR